MLSTNHPTHSDDDQHKGAVEGDREEDPQQGNRNAPALDADGLPARPVPIAEDRIGANMDDGEVANADETGRTTDAVRDEITPIENGSET